jgi:hypothetical protein
MTITDSDIEKYQSTVGDFVPQHTPDGCYPTAIKNIINELAERKGMNGMAMSLSDINDICNYEEGMYTQEEIVPEALSRELSEFGYEATKATAPEMDYAELQEIIDNEDTSLPIVELDPRYFEQVEDYKVQGRQEASHVVIVFKVNDDRVLYYDPYEKFFEKSSRVSESPREWDKTGFYELWSGRHSERWTFWVGQAEQSLLKEFGV